MIKSIRIKNFQSHKETELDFHPGVNIILGSSDSGKTAIIRAIRWLVFNRPSGDEFRSYWGGDTRVILDLDNGKIERKRTKNENEYIINDNLLLKALKIDVPDSVKELLNLDKVNIQHQMDNSFLFSNTPGEVALFFNRVAHLEQIHTTLKSLNHQLFEVNQEYKFEKAKLQEYREQRKQYSFLPGLEKEVKNLQAKLKRLDELKRNINTLVVLINKVREIEGNYVVQQKILKISPQVKKLIKKRQDWEKLITRKQKLYRIKNDFWNLEQEISGYQDLLSAKNKIILLNENWNQYVNLQTKVKKLQKLILQLKDNISVWRIQYTTHNQLKQLFNREFPDICPLCGCQVSKCTH